MNIAKLPEATRMDDMLRYLDQMVEPTIVDFEQNPTSMRHAFLACVAAFHAIDCLAYPKKRSATLRQKFRKDSAEFATVDDVAHSFKHVVTGDRRKPRLTPNRLSRARRHIMVGPSGIYPIGATPLAA